MRVVLRHMLCRNTTFGEKPDRCGRAESRCKGKGMYILFWLNYFNLGYKDAIRKCILRIERMKKGQAEDMRIKVS